MLQARLVRRFLLTSRRHLLLYIAYKDRTVNRRFTLSRNEVTGKWELRQEATERVLASWTTKTAATRKGALEKVLGREGGAVIIRKLGGVFEEERRFAAR